MFGKIFFFGLVAMSFVCSTLGGSSSSISCDYYIKVYYEKEAILNQTLARIADEGISEVTALHEANPTMWFDEFGTLSSEIVDAKFNLMRTEVYGFFDIIGSIMELSSEVVENYLLNGLEAPYPLSCIKQFANILEVFQTEYQRLVDFADETVRKHPFEN